MTSSSPFRALLIGCGGISHAWLTPIQKHFGDLVAVVGLADLRREAAEARAAEFGLGDAWIGTDLAEGIAATQPDVIFNCTIPEAHFQTCKLAMESGCHVLVEKPAASDTGEAQALLAIANKTGKRMAVLQNRRYLPWGRAIRDAIAGGAIGDVTTVCADFFMDPHFGGFREQMHNVLLLDMAIHTFDQARFLTGTRPAAAYCHEFNPKGSWFAHGASAIATFEMDGGVVFAYRGSWCAKGMKTHWAGAWRIIGDRGTLLWDGEQLVRGETEIGPWDGKAFIPPVRPAAVEEPVPDPAMEGHAGVIGDYLRALRAGTVPPTDISDNLYSLAMVEAAVRSAASKRRIAIAEMLAETGARAG